MSQDAQPKRGSGADTEWDAARIAATHNTARFFVENRAVSWVLLLGCLAWGIFGYNSMPKQKAPTIPVRVAIAVTPWPGVDAQRIEMLVTRPIEEKIAENSTIYPSTPSDFGIQSITLPGLSIVQVQIDDHVSDIKTELNDINLRLLGLNSALPPGAGPIQWNSGFGQTAALMLTVASPPERKIALELRARTVATRLAELRADTAGHGGPRFWQSISPEPRQPHYAQLIVEVSDRDDTPNIVYPLQRALSARIPGAEIDVRQLELNPVSLPIALLLSSRGDAGDRHSDSDLVTIRQLADQLSEIVRSAPSVERVRHDWLNESYRIGWT